MNSISCVMNAIHHQPGIRIPKGELTVDSKFAADFIQQKTNCTSIDTLSDGDLLSECCHALKLDLVCIQSKEIVGSKSNSSMKLIDVRRFCDEDLFVFWIVDGVFQSAMERFGLMTLFGKIADSSDDIYIEFGHISDHVVTTMAKGVAAGAHGIIIADDIAYNHGTYISPEFFEKYLLSIWKTQVRAAWDLGVPVFFHSDGNLNAVLPVIAEAGFNGLQCIEPSAGMDIHAVKQQYGKDLCLMGNIDPSLLTETGEKDAGHISHSRLRRAVFKLKAISDGDGGFIFGTCSGLYSGMSLRLVQTMYRLVNEAGLRS